MKKAFIITAAFAFLLTGCSQKQQKDGFVTIKGHVTDYEGRPLPDASVVWKDESFSKNLFSTMTDVAGHYEISIKKGRYHSMMALNMDEYPVTGSTLPEEDQRLEFWAWDFIADRDMTFDMQYHRLEVYGLNVFRIQGATPGYTIYCRPMSLTRTLEWQKDPTPAARLAPSPEELEVEVTIDGEKVPVRMKQEVREYWSETESSNAYLLFTDMPKEKTDLPYRIFRVRLTDLANGDKGEAVYFLEKKTYVD